MKRMVEAELIPVPYHLGRRDVGVGRGPAQWLSALGVAFRDLSAGELPAGQLDAIVAVNRALAEAIGERTTEGQLPVTVSGDCNSCLGTLAALGRPEETGLIWFDAHGDFNTPETSPSGFFDGMSLAIAAGDCHRQVWSRIGNSGFVAPSHILLIATRDLDPKEKPRVENSLLVAASEPIRRDGLDAVLTPKLDTLAARVRDVYVHIDIDAVDPAEAPGAGYHCPGGLSVGDVEAALAAIGARFRIRAAAFTNFDPAKDLGGRTVRSQTRLLTAVIGAASGPARSPRASSA